MNSRVAALLAGIVSILAYIGLAILGWGGFGPFFVHPARVVLTVVTVLLAGAAFFTSGNISSGTREDRGNRWVFIPIFAIGLLLAYVPAYTDRKEIWTLDGDAVRWLGVALYTLFGAVRLWPVFVLGRRFSGLVALQPGHTLVTGGIYAVVRHPSYLGLIVSTLGWALAFRSGIGVLLALCLIPPLVARMHAEERFLQSAFGREYEAYRAATRWRLIPFVY